MILNKNTKNSEKMNEKVRNLWVNALKSGKYAQYTGPELRNGNKFSVLGVLCQLHAEKTGNSWEGNWYLHSEYGLPCDVADWAGIPEYRDPIINNLPLSKYNSGYMSYGYPERLEDPIPSDTIVTPMNFNRLANLIEENL